MKKSICILDYKTGNIQSLMNIFNKLMIPYKYSNNKKDIINYTHLVLPGVGSFDVAYKNAMKFLPMKIIYDEVFNKFKPILGICVGMQIMATYGEEGESCTGLDWIKGKVIKINTHLSLPHVGWNQLIKNKNSLLTRGIDDKDFYFLNSYYFNIKNKKQVIAFTKYGIKFPSIIQNKNIYGVQFHPEKSQKNGSRLLKNFFELH